MKEITAIIESNFIISANYFKLTLNAGEIEKSSPGQFIQILCRDENSTEPFLRRPFSIFLQNNSIIEIVYKVIGRGTNFLCSQDKGKNLSILYPLGNSFDYANIKNKKILFISGGCGIAGLNYLINEISEKNSSIKLLAGFKNKNEMPEFVKKYSLEKKIIFDNDGFVTDLLKKENIDFYDKFFICGPSAMISSCGKLLELSRLQGRSGFQNG